MKKILKKAAPVLACLAILAMGFSSVTALAAPSGSPFASEDLEKATGAFKIVRSKDKIPDTLVGAETFAFPYEGGDKQLKIAKKSDNATKNYVIEGNQSLYFTNTGSGAADSVSPLITKGNAGTPLNFSPDKVYVARFLFKEIATFSSTSSLMVVARTWSESDPWVDFEIKPKASGGFTAKVSRNGRTYDKIAVQQVEKDVYEVALRFTGLQPSADEFCYLFWQLNGQGGVSIDGFKVYESKGSPNTFFERAAYGTGDTEPTKAPTGSGNHTTASPKNTTTATKGGGPATASQGQTADTAAPQTETTGSGTAGETEASGAPSAGESTAPSGGETKSAGGQPEGLSNLALGMLIAAIVVGVGSGGAIAAYLIIKKKKSNG